MLDDDQKHKRSPLNRSPLHFNLIPIDTQSQYFKQDDQAIIEEAKDMVPSISSFDVIKTLQTIDEESNGLQLPCLANLPE